MSPVRRLSQIFLKHRYGATLFAFLAAAIVTGVACVLFMWSFDAVLARRLDFVSFGPWVWVVTPVFFLLSVEFIRRAAPYAAGTGIPQAIFAAQHLSAATERPLKPLVSLLTMAVKIAALLAAVWVGASTGREGPSVHIATCVFLGVILVFRRLFGANVDLRSATVAGAAAGLAAAFNTPLAGVTFAIEELTPDLFAGIKDFVLIAIIVAAIAAKAMTGEYGYFGRLTEPPALSVWAIVLVGVAGGVGGAVFSTLILEGQKFLAKFHAHRWGRYAVPVVLSLGVLGIASFYGVSVLGPGNQTAKDLLNGRIGPEVAYFPLAKVGATLLTYWSGVAGGIFAPCLSIGAALGADVARGLGGAAASAALVGMAAFLSGTIQAPITAFVVIFEMTNDHQMLLPVMLASLIAFMTAHLLGAKHLYKALAENYRPLLDSKQG
jgi:chloride channel protein, CIC family